MRFKEQPVHTHGDRGAGQWLDHLPIAAGRCTQPTRLLHAVRRVEHDGYTQGAHLREAPHVVHQAAVAEERAALAQQYVATTGRDKLVDHMPHVPRRQELTLLHVHRARRGRRGHQQIGLARQKGRNLDHIAHVRHRRSLVRFVDVGRHRQARRLAHAAENVQSALEPGARDQPSRSCGSLCRTKP